MTNNNSIKTLKGKKLVIIGGAGFIGHNLSIKAVNLGAEVHCVDSLKVNNIGFYTSNYLTNVNSERYISFLNSNISQLYQSL